MTKSIEKRVKNLEDILNVNRNKRGVATVVYDPDICSQSDLPLIDADVILCLPDNGHRIPHGKVMLSEGYLVSWV